MTQDQAPPGGPDLTQGVALTNLVDGKHVGHGPSCGFLFDENCPG